jgi:hypothetical protein
MPSCAECADFSTRRSFPTPAEYLDFVRQRIDFVNRRDFLLIQAACRLEDVLKLRRRRIALFTSSGARDAALYFSSM